MGLIFGIFVIGVFALIFLGAEAGSDFTIIIAIALGAFIIAAGIKAGAEDISEAKEKEAKAIEKEAKAIEKLAEEIKKKELKVNIDSNEKKSKW